MSETRAARPWRLAPAIVVIALAASVVLGPPAAGAAVPNDRYGFVNGCYSLQDGGGQPIAASSGPFRMQATDLGTYLFYGVTQDFLADPGNGIPTPVAAPSPAAEWNVTGSAAAGYSLTNVDTNNMLSVTFASANGCAEYPEASTGATGTPAPAADPMGRTSGWADVHMHWMGFELFGGDWHCGRPWHPYGVAYALPDCAQYDGGTNGQARAFMDGRNPGAPYDTVGWPTFNYWPGHDRLAEEGSYYKGVERAWLSGERLLVADFVDNEALCQIMTTAHNPCHDMDSVRLQNRDLEDFEDYVDAQSGGPGKGWLRIVTNPYQARRVMNEGKLAVVKGVELSRILDCGELNGAPECNQAQVDAGLSELWGMGVRSFFPVHKFDNGFGGTKMDSGELGLLVNAGNAAKTGHFWNVGPCEANDGQDETQVTTPPTALVAPLIYGPTGLLPATTPLPIYGSPPHCNQRGLSDIGAYLINKMIDQHFIIETDHMSEKTADGALDIVEGRHYPGVIHSHGGWSGGRSIQRIKAVGGLSIGPGIIGSDINGLADQPGPDSAHPIQYPFTSRDGQVTFDRERWGQRTFDLNTDGVAQYGLYADRIERQRVLSSDAEMDTVFSGAENYLAMWERAWQHTPSAPTARPARCGGQQATLVGTPGDDKLRGTAGRDVIAGLRGADRILGLDGRDLLCGNRGRDALVGGAGRDRLRGGSGRDVLRGGIGRDRCVGGQGTDRVKGCEVGKL